MEVVHVIFHAGEAITAKSETLGEDSDILKRMGLSQVDLGQQLFAPS
jgi:hypothetical protein